ncbi:TraX family protein [Haloimpatiens massiliensis]|uniref:TraX family protein n=1 Tax=Haloimpatiens massiliensis TaxID=1658110 RepID=UPI000C850E23|nr:TraX family protein [Haloimpatiens massiliensis]
MNGAQLKLMAIIIMLIDHTGALLFPKVRILRVIGRLAFPIFAYFISEGYIKTSNVKKYQKRLLVFALISQIPFYLAFKNVLYLNIFFTLFLGLYAIKVYDEKGSISIIWIIGILAQIINTDYGLYGVFTIYLFYKYHEDFKTMAKKQVFLNVIFVSVIFLITILSAFNKGKDGTWIFMTLIGVSMQAVSLVSLFFIKRYNGERGRSMKYLFYGFYPVHLMILWMIKSIV